MSLIPTKARMEGFLALILASLFSIQAIANPQINQVVLKDGSFQQDKIMIIRGSHFGAKAQSAPVLYDWGTRVIENGILNSSRESATDGYKLLNSHEGPADPIYDKPSSTS